LIETTWRAFADRWPRLRPPLRPHAAVRERMCELVAGSAERALLLGVTPELADLASHTVAVDCSDGMLAAVWPGNSRTRQAIKGNWLHLPCASGSFTVAIGDGSFNCLQYPEDYRQLCRELARTLRPGGRVAMRFFVTPDRCESVEAARARTMAGCLGSIHALKWVLAHAICRRTADPNVPVQTILDVFNHEFPDRRELEQATGWSQEDIGEIDAYDRMTDVFSFPTSSEILSVIPRDFSHPHFVLAGTYDLAERCPLLVMELTP